METKAHIRKQVLKKRDDLTADFRSYASKVIAEKVLRLPEYIRARKVLLYVSFRSEVDTKALIQCVLQDKKQVYVPKVCGKEIRFFQIWSLTELKTSCMGILEPKERQETEFITGEEENQETVLMLMPGAAFDKARNRLGYGGGYYDRFLARHNKIMTAGLFFSCQETDEIGAEAFDKKPDIIITEEYRI